MKVTSFLKRQTVVEGYKQVVVVVVFRLSRETQQSFCSITSEPRLHRTTQVRTGSVCSHLHRRLHRPANQTRVNQTLCWLSWSRGPGPRGPGPRGPGPRGPGPPYDISVNINHATDGDGDILRLSTVKTGLDVLNVWRFECLNVEAGGVEVNLSVSQVLLWGRS